MRRISISILLITSILFAVKPAHAQISFIENKGQWNQKINFRSDIESGAFFLEKNGFTVVLNHPGDLQKFSEQIHGHSHDKGKINNRDKEEDTVKANAGISIRSHAYKVNFVGASANVQIQPEKTLPTYNNYFIGNDKSKWQGGCKIYQAVLYKNIYPNIDVRYYTDGSTLKYDIIVNPGGKVRDIVMQYEGVDKLSVKNEELLIQTSVGELKELYPYTYQLHKNERQVLNCKYQLSNKQVRFKVSNYSPDATIVIDPTLIFSTFTGSAADNWGYTATPGPDGTMFAAGIAFDFGYKTSPGAYRENFIGGVDEDGNGPYDIAIIKLSSNGADRLYGTYLGGNGNEQPHSMICDAQGNLIVAGRTNSSTYPTTIPFIGTAGGYDIVVSKFNATGTLLPGSIKIGGSGDDGVNIKPKYVSLAGIAPGGQTDGAFETRRNYGDDARSEVILNAANEILLVSCTQSINFPVVGAAFQTVFGGGRQDGLLLKFTPGLTALQYSSFFGGPGSDACFVLSINPTNSDIYVGGATTSTNLPGNKSGVIGSTYQGGLTDGFVFQLNPSMSSIVKTTYLGTAGNDMLYGVQFDKFGFPYVMGTTTGSWPVINALYSANGGKQFISKLQPDLSAYVYSTVFGTNAPVPNISPIAFLVDRCQNVYVSGWGGGISNSKQYPSAGTRGLPVTADAIKRTTDGDDFYFFVLEKNAVSQLFGSFFGQTDGELGDHVDGGTSRFDANGIIYQAMCANCGGPRNLGFFPTTPGAWARTNGSPRCNEAAVKIEMNFSGIASSVQVSIDGVANDTAGCAPLIITFTDTIAKAKKYIWNFGDGSPEVTTTLATVDHLYMASGYYNIRLVGIDSTKCNIVDTAYGRVKIGTNEVTPSFTATKLAPCTNLSFEFTNTTTSIFGGENTVKYIWDFGDGSKPDTVAYSPPVKHTYASIGTYQVKLTVIDSSFCNAPQDTIKTIRLADNVKALIETPSKGCAPYNAVFKNTSAGGTDFIWDFGDGSPVSNQIAPTHLYTRPGLYKVRLIAIDLFTCNQRDTVDFDIEVFAVAKADFSFTPVTPIVNIPTQFNNASLNATSYLWKFGDGDSSFLTSPSHQFNATKTFNVCLLAMNEAGCVDTVCKDVQAIVEPLIDVPNAFTPGSNDINSVIRVAGFGVVKMSWNIYNRWGQLVFTSSSTKIGWNGEYKNKPQPMDVYTYTLDAVLSDGKEVKKTGDISLIR